MQEEDPDNPKDATSRTEQLEKVKEVIKNSLHQ